MVQGDAILHLLKTLRAQVDRRSNRTFPLETGGFLAEGVRRLYGGRQASDDKKCYALVV